MRRVLFGLIWLIALIIGGGLLLSLLGSIAAHRVLPATQSIARLGAEFGADAFVLLLCFAALPGVRRHASANPPLGPMQAFLGLLGFGATMVAGGIALYNLLFILQIVLNILHSGARFNLSGSAMKAGTALTGELAVALWLVWYLRRLGPFHREDGSAAGIALRPTEPGGIRAAIAVAAGIILVVVVLYHFIPANLKALRDLPENALFAGPIWTLLPVLFLALFFAPALEELLFRGIAFAGIAARFGPLWATLVTTIVFMAVHAPEKIHYLPGFVDVGLMALGGCWLRLRYRSIRPAICLHILYNGGLILASGAFMK